MPASLNLSSSPWEKADLWIGSAGSKLSWVIGQWWKRIVRPSCTWTLIPPEQPGKHVIIVWHGSLWLWLWDVLHSRQAFEVPHPHPPEMCQIWKYSTPFCPDVNSIYYTTNKWKEIFINRAPWSSGCLMSIITLSSSYLSPSCFHSLINILLQNFILN